jgi:ubiquinone/menaquinone biosynthesis C-methylase UbiE
MKLMAEISDYDKFDYDYSTYWKGRSYENSAEKHILNKVFNSKRGQLFLDIGGSYGRLTSTYHEQYKKPIILDYSLKTLQRNNEILQSKYPNVELIAANAYKLPFKNNSFDGALMVRVLHHIEKPKIYFKELRRILKHDSTYVQEYANKKHIKAVIRALLKLDLSIFSPEPYQQPKAHNSEGSQDDQESIFYNYHPKYIKNLLQTNKFILKKKYGCSFLRSPLIKKIFNDDILMFFEKIFQETLSWSDISPSIFLDTQVKKDEGEYDIEDLTLEDILACPTCKDSLIFESHSVAVCNKCSQSFFKKDGIWDFRVK